MFKRHGSLFNLSSLFSRIILLFLLEIAIDNIGDEDVEEDDDVKTKHLENRPNKYQAPDF